MMGLWQASHNGRPTSEAYISELDAHVAKLLLSLRFSDPQFQNNGCSMSPSFNKLAHYDSVTEPSQENEPYNTWRIPQDDSVPRIGGNIFPKSSRLDHTSKSEIKLPEELTLFEIRDQVKGGEYNHDLRRQQLANITDKKVLANLTAAEKDDRGRELCKRRQNRYRQRRKHLATIQRNMHS